MLSREEQCVSKHVLRLSDELEGQTRSSSRRTQSGTPKMPPSSAVGSIDHRRSEWQLRAVVQPASNISMPAQAIIAALSAQSSGGG